MKEQLPDYYGQNNNSNT